VLLLGRVISLVKCVCLAVDLRATTVMDEERHMMTLVSLDWSWLSRTAGAERVNVMKLLLSRLAIHKHRSSELTLCLA
jgi:hypothetical protein